MKLPEFEYALPATLDAAIGLLSSTDGAKVLSGGQSLMPMMAYRLARPSMLVDLRGIPGLDRIRVEEDGIRLGARVRWVDIECDDRLRTGHPLMVEMISNVAHYQVRNRGTVGGSLAHADPAAEMPGLSVVCDCEIAVTGEQGVRTLPAAELFAGPLETTLADSDIITEVRFPPWPADRRWAFIELSRRKGDFALCGVAVFYDQDADGLARDVHVGSIGVQSTPSRLRAAEAALEGRRIDEASIAAARAAAMSEVDPMDDLHANADYRRSLVGTLTARALRRAAALGDAS